DEPVQAVFLDIGETLLDRSRADAAWARWLGVRPHTFSAVFGAVIARGGPVLDVRHHFRPGEPYAALRAEMTAAVGVPPLTAADLYPGARVALQQLRAAGLY